MSVNVTINIRYPAVALKRGKSRPSKFIFSENIDFAIPAHNPEDCPVAVSWKETREHAPHRGESRWVNDCHHQRTTVPRVERDDNVAAFIQKTAGYFLREEMGVQTDPDEVTAFDPDRYRLIDDRSRLAKAETLRLITDRVTVIGDRIFMRGGEPSYYVAPRNHKSGKNTSTAYKLIDLPVVSASTARRYFSLNDLKGVEEFSPKAKEAPARYDVDIMMPETLRTDHASYNLMCAAMEFRDILEVVSAKRGLPVFQKSESVVEEGLISLGRMLPFRDEIDVASNNLDQFSLHEIVIEMSRLYPYAWVDSEGDGRVRSSLKTIQQISEIWQERPLEIEAAFSAP